MTTTTHKIFIGLFILIVTIFLSCGGEMEQKKITYSSLQDVPDSAWEKLSTQKIYFGHNPLASILWMVCRI